MDYCSLLTERKYESVVNEIERYLNKVAEADVWLRENPLEFEWGGTSMIEDKGEIFPSFTVPTHHPGFKQLEEAHEHIHNKKLEHGMSTTVTDGGWTAHFGIPTILYGPGSLEEAHSVDEKIKAKELAQYSDVLYTFLKEWYEHPQSYKSS